MVDKFLVIRICYKKKKGEPKVEERKIVGAGVVNDRKSVRYSNFFEAYDDAVTCVI